jgi:hypothetical protein
MTNEDKAILILFVESGWTFKQIQKEYICSDSTIRKYMKAFSNTNR